jgi:radical SAM superfamily enzyme YgiQ (UPF0313 family)
MATIPVPEVTVRVLLISANTERISMVTIPLGLGLVAAATRQAGHQVAFLDLLGSVDVGLSVRQAIERATPEVIGVSIRNIDDQNAQNPRFLLEQAREVVAACRAHSAAPVVLGGAGYSLFPRAALDYLGADDGVRGDGEAAFPALLAHLRSGLDPRGVPGVYLAGKAGGGGRAEARDLDGLPLWDPALERYADLGVADIWVPVQTRRGCPNDCSYCSTALIQGRALRQRSVPQVLDTLRALVDRGFRRFYFVDNNFNVPEAEAFALCSGLRTLPPGVSWRCILYPRPVGEMLVKAMAASGCVEVSLGFESGCEAILRGMNKHYTPDDVRRTVALLKRHGIRRMGFLLLGGPGETRETVEQSLAFAKGLDLDGLKVTIGIRIYPGTPLARQAVLDGMIAPDDDLLRPRFYLAPGLEPWIHEATVGMGT